MQQELEQKAFVYLGPCSCKPFADTPLAAAPDQPPPSTSRHGQKACPGYRGTATLAAAGIPAVAPADIAARRPPLPLSNPVALLWPPAAWLHPDRMHITVLVASKLPWTLPGYAFPGHLELMGGC